jgi:hypothetical protein
MQILLELACQPICLESIVYKLSIIKYYRGSLLDLLEMNESNKSNNVSTASNKLLNELIEKKTETQCAEAVVSIKSKEELQAAVINIMKEGEKEFVKENKRTMTYLELRSIYG